MIKVRGYIFSRPFMGERVPQHVQNLVIRDYCERQNLHFLLSATEYAMPDCYLMLEQILEDFRVIDGVVAYSLFQLPDNIAHRARIYDRIINEKKILHFAVEGLKAFTHLECERIETLWRIRKTLPNCLNSEEFPSDWIPILHGRLTEF
jgi:sporadic carbohydrate cluster protein (TIGR04323 family)